METQTWRTDLWTQWRGQAGRGWERRGEDGMYGESNMETYITTCKINIQWEFAVCLRKLKQGFCINLEGWDGEENRREV